MHSMTPEVITENYMPVRIEVSIQIFLNVLGHLLSIFLKSEFVICLLLLDLSDGCFENVVGAIERPEYFSSEESSIDWFIGLWLFAGHGMCLIYIRLKIYQIRSIIIPSSQFSYFYFSFVYSFAFLFNFYHKLVGNSDIIILIINTYKISAWIS